MEEDQAIDELMGEAMYHMIFHYNNSRKLWFAIPRDQYVDYWNGTCADCLAHKDINELQMLVLQNYMEDEKE